MADLTCPKCQGQMRSYERNGITVDQCADCRGIFLDRGELERLIDAEASHYDATPPPRQDRDREHESSGHRKRKKRSFLEDLFE